MQYDLLAGDTTEIANSLTSIFNACGIGGNCGFDGALQLGPDNKIYASRLQKNFLGVINQPNLQGLLCNYVDSAVYLTEKCQLGLPNCIKKYSSTLSTKVNIGNDTIICEGETLTLNAISENATYLWQDGSTNPTYKVEKDGFYWVKVTNSCDVKKDSITVKTQKCLQTLEVTLEMPNIFTPNNDGVNDYFKPNKINNINQATLAIYNRWGQKLFETDHLSSGWNGKYNNKDCPDGTYYWILKYKTTTDEEKSLNGFLLLTR